jgi:hypothetical protein
VVFFDSVVAGSRGASSNLWSTYVSSNVINVAGNVNATLNVWTVATDASSLRLL